MGKVKQREDGRYEAKYTVQTATGLKRRSVYGSTQKEVAEKLARAVADGLDGLAVDSENVRVAEYMSRWLGDSVHGSVKRRTYESYVSIVRRHINPAFGEQRLRALSPVNVQALYRIKLEEGLSPTTVEHIHTTLHRALKQAVRWQLISRNVCDAVSVPKRVSPETTPLSPEQAKTLLAVVEGDPYECLYVLALTMSPERVLRYGLLRRLELPGRTRTAGAARDRRCGGCCG